MACEQEREQRKRRKRVMGQLGLDKREDDENDRDPCDKIIVDLVPATPQSGR